MLWLLFLYIQWQCCKIPCFDKTMYVVVTSPFSIISVPNHMLIKDCILRKVMYLLEVTCTWYLLVAITSKPRITIMMWLTLHSLVPQIFCVQEHDSQALSDVWRECCPPWWVLGYEGLFNAACSFHYHYYYSPLILIALTYKKFLKFCNRSGEKFYLIWISNTGGKNGHVVPSRNFQNIKENQLSSPTCMKFGTHRYHAET